METLYPNSCFTNNPALVSNDFFFLGHVSSSNEWTKEENKLFEKALAIYDKETPDRWWNIANMAGRSMEDVIAKYRELLDDVSEIEAGRFPIPGYLMSSSSSFAFDNDDDGSSKRDYDGSYRKKPSSGGGGRGGSSDQERKKGIPWTEEEHRRFLKGLIKYGKGDWRNISRNFVFTKTPTQVASHAQKYFIRQQQQQLVCDQDQSKRDNHNNNKRRPSIHDITTNNINMTQSYSAPPQHNTNLFDHQKQNPDWNWMNSSSSSSSAGWNWLEERAMAIFRANYLQGANIIAPSSSSNALFKLQQHKEVILNLPSSADTMQLGIQSTSTRFRQ